MAVLDARVSVASDLKIVGVVPASGASRRMGRPKAAMELAGRTFVQRAVDALRAGACHDVIVVIRRGDAAVEDAARATGAQVLVNDDPGEGPITSMRLAIKQLTDDVDAIAWLPVDFPLVDGEIVRQLRDRVAVESPPLALPVHEYFVEGVRHEKRGHPAIFTRTLFAELIDPALEGGARTVVHRHLSQASVELVRDPRVVVDIDTPEIFAAVEAGTPPYTDRPMTSVSEQPT